MTMTRRIKAGSTDVSVVLRIIDSTDGTPETGVVFNTSGIDLEYRRELEATTDITEATLAALTTAHADGGFLHIGNGYYRLDLPDAAVAAGATGVLIHGTVTGMVVIGTYIELVAYDPYDTVRLGLTALPNAAAAAAGGLFTRGTGAGQINQDANGRIDVNVEAWNTTAVPAEHTAGYPVTTIKDGAGTGEINTNAGKVVGVELVDVLTTYTGNTPQTGDSFARLGAPAGASVSADIAAIEAQTDDIGAAGAGLTAITSVLGTPAGASLAADIAAIEAQTDDIGAAGAGLTALPWNAAWDTEVQSEVDDALVVQRLDELVNADSDIDGAAPPAVGSVVHELMTKTAGSFTYDQATDSLEALRDNLATAAALATVQADTDDIQTRLPAALVGGRVDASVGAMAAGVVTAAAVATGALDADALAADAVAEIADGVWDEAIAGHLGAGSTGLALNSAGAAGDPWSTALPGAYGAGTAGNIVGNNLNDTITSRLAPTVAGRTLDVSAAGEAGLDWANIGSPTTAQNLSATNIDVDQVVASVSGAVGSVTGAVASVVGNVGGNVVGSVGSVVAGVTLAASAVQAIWDALTSALTTVGSIGKLLVDRIDAAITSRLAPTVAARTLDVSAGGEAGLDWANIGSPTTAQNLSGTNIDTDQVVASVAGAVGSVTGAVGSVAGNVGGNVVGSVGSVVGAVGSVGAGGITAASIATGAIDADAVAADAANEIADALLARNIAGGSSAGRIVTDALRLLRNRRAIAAGTLTAYQEDDTTPAWTAAVATAVSDPVSSIDPA